jgi:Spy/CpxP family protein refolding chaperone
MSKIQRKPKIGGQMKKSFLIFALITISLLAYNSNFAQKNENKTFKKHVPGIERLNLTDVQQKKFDQIHFAQEERGIDLRAKLQKNRLEIKKLLSSPNFNENELLSLTKNASDLRSEMMQSRVKTWLEVYKILDDKQREEWSHHIAQMADEFGERRFDKGRFDIPNMRERMMQPKADLDDDDEMDKN